MCSFQSLVSLFGYSPLWELCAPELLFKPLLNLMFHCRCDKWALNYFLLSLFLFPLFWLHDPLPFCLWFDFHSSLLFTVSLTYSTFFLYLWPPSFPCCLDLIIHSPYCYVIPSPHPHHIVGLLSTTASFPLFYHQISACVSGLNTWSMSLHYVMVSLRTSDSPWSGSLSCSAKPTHFCVPETWVPSSATSNSQNWTTLRPSGVTI